jgi:NADH-quinone oxidoreductase subunit L
MSALYALIPLFPLLASITIALAGRRLGEASGKVGILAMGLSFGLSVAAFVELVLRNEPISIPLYELLRSGNLVVDLGLYIDQLTVLMLLLVTGVSFVVHVYSSRYMIGDARYSRFFAVMALFTFAMVTLVMSSNLLMIFMCWEIMGICSYLLISHQADRKAAGYAATKVFLVNAIADVGLLFGIILTFATFETLDIREILDPALLMSKSGETINLLGWAGLECQVQSITMIVLFLFMGCMGKSAQVPFHVWLPYAMEAPTPISALIHAATMVNAGPFLLVRFSPLVMLSPVAMTVIAIVGGTTALFAAVVSLTQTDVKKMLAYSTISQIGFMIMACGLGAFVVAIFHMLAHGCLKGFLFLSTGSQLESAAAHGHEEPGSGRSRPSWLLYLGALILACVPPFLIFSGPYESLWTVHKPSAAAAFWVIGLLTVFFTAMYLFRGVTSLFGRNPSAVVQPRFFSPAHLLGISVGALGLIALLLVLWSWFVPFLGSALGKPDLPAAGVWQLGSLFPLLIWPLLAAFAGWALACLLHTKPKLFYVVRSNWAKTMYVLFLNKFYFDEIYSVYIVRPSIRFARWMWRAIDVRGIDRLIHGFATRSVLLARWLWRAIDVRGIDRLIHGFATRSVLLARWLWGVVDVRGIDRAVVEGGRQSVGLARWLWEVIDVRRIEKNSERIGHAADATGHKLQDVEPRTLQHHLLVLNLWLVGAIVFFYWFVL